MKLARELMKPGALFGVIMVAVALNVQAPILVVTHALGGTAVVAFATVRTMANLARQAVGQFNRSIEPEVTRLYALNDFGSLRSLHRLAVAGASTLSIAIVGALWFYGVDVVRVWTHAKVHVQPSFVRLMLIYVVLHVIWLASSTFTVATNNHRQLAWQYLASNGIAIVFATTTIARLGLNAVPIGLILGDAVACYHFVIRDACKICREPYVRFAIRTWLGLICVTTVSLCVGLLSSRIHTGSDVLQWVIAGTLTLVASLFTTWWLWFTDTDRALVVRLFRLPRRALNQA
jgi:O-antigen/teichoic acid export membrane protein